MESHILYSNDNDKSGWKLVGQIDNSYGCCDVDITELFTDLEGKFHLLTASGCSCWAGEYEEREFLSLDDFVAHMKSEETDRYIYNPSPEAIKELLEQVKQNA